MSKRLNKVLMAVLAAVVAICMVIATAGLTTARADVTTGNITMLDSAQVRQTGEMGIRFSATISATDYEALKAQGAEFGMIIAPADWVENDDDLAFGSSKLSLYDGTQGANDKFFNKGTNTPVLDVTDIDKDGDMSEYVLTCSFIKIKESNFDRNFKARAYYKVGNDYFHSEYVVERNIYTVASNALINGDVEDEVVTDYLVGIVGKVADEDSTLNVTVDGDVANKGDKFTVKATINTGKKVVNTAVALSVERDGAVVEDGLTYNEATGEYTVNTAGKLTLVGKVGNKTIDVKELTAKRTDVKVTLIPNKLRTSTSGHNDYVPFDDTSRVFYTDFQNVSNNVIGNGVILTTQVEDPENPDATVAFSDYTLSGNPTYYKLLANLNKVYIGNLDRTKKIQPVTGVSVTYTDAYGLEYTASLPVYGSNTLFDPAYYGQIENRFTATDALIVDSGKEKNGTKYWTTIEDVSLTSSKAEDLIRFTVMNKAGFEGQVTNKMWVFVISEAGNPNNWVKVSYGRFGGSAAYISMGMNTNAWSQTKLGYGYRGTSFTTLVNESSNDDPGWYYNGAGIANCNNGINNLATDSVKYVGEMLGFSIINSEVFVNAGIADGTYGAFQSHNSILPKAQQNNETYGITEWSGFDGFFEQGKKVDISFAATNFRAETTQYMIIDTLGGQKVTADWLNKMYYSYTTTNFPYLESDAANA